jgi:alpha-tubulin suppressor-like RCC1 family protein
MINNKILRVSLILFGLALNIGKGIFDGNLLMHVLAICQDVILSTEDPDNVYSDSMQGVYSEDIQKYIEEEMISPPSYVQLDEPILQISAGGYFTVALTQSRKVYQWGLGLNGQKSLITFPENVTIRQVLAGGSSTHFQHVLTIPDYHSFALSEDGQVYSWGRNNKLLGSVKHVNEVPSIPQLLSGPLRQKNIVSIGVGLDHALLVTDTGKVYSLGDGTKGQTGLVHLFSSTVEDKVKYAPILIKAGSLEDVKVVSACCGSDHSLLLAGI